MKKDGLVEVHDDKIIITEIGKDFAQFITNRFRDRKYSSPSC